MTLQEALKTAGFYSVKNLIGLVFIEVCEDKIAYQIDPITFLRDGVLSRDGWNTWAVLGITKLPLSRLS